MRWERLSVFFLLAALPLYGVRFHIGGHPSHVLELLIVVSFAVTALTALLRERANGCATNNDATRAPVREHVAARRLMRPIPLFVALLLVAASVSLFTAPDFVAAFASFRHFYVEPLMVAWMIRRTFAGTDDALRLFSALSIPVVPLAVVAIFQQLDWYPIPAVYQVEHRSTSLYSYANAVGLYMAPMIAGALAAVWYHFFMSSKRAESGFFATWTKAKIGYFVSVIGFGSVAIVFSQTEAAWLALGALLGIAGLVYARTRVLTLLAGIAGVLFLSSDFPIAKRLLQKLLLWDFSGVVRRDMWAETMAFLRDHWVLGAGLAGYQTRIAPYHHNDLIEIFWFPHNVFLNIWVELGALGMVAFIALAAWYIRRILRVGSAHWLVTAPMIVIMVHGLYDVPFFKPDLAVMTATLLTMLCVMRGTDEQSIA